MKSPLRKNLVSERVHELPLREAAIVRPETSVAEAVDEMRKRHLGCSIVSNAQGQPIGFFTERTLIELLLAGKQLPVERVGDHLDPDWYPVRFDAPILVVYELVVDRGARFVCVVDAEGNPLGLTGQRGLAEYIADHYPHRVMTQRIGALPKMTHREGG